MSSQEKKAMCVNKISIVAQGQSVKDVVLQVYEM